MTDAERLKLIYSARVWMLTDALMPLLHKSRPFIVRKDYIANDIANLVRFHGYYPESRANLVHDLIYGLQKFLDKPISNKLRSKLSEKINQIFDDPKYDEPIYV